MSVPNVVAIISTFNEADIIGEVIRHLVAQGVSVYLLDDGSSDDTVREAEEYMGRGLIAIEQIQPKQQTSGETVGRFDWGAILRRKEALACTLTADWFIHHDADEFRESPWLQVTLADAIGHVDALGYNAVDFQLFNFWPTAEHVGGGGDVCATLTRYEPGEPWNRLQVKCWKNLGIPVDLASSGGHEARFAGRNVFPIRFVLRHYPVRSESHGQRKVFVDRLPRFLPSERERGWHVQYDAFARGESFLCASKVLTPYDRIRVRLELALRHRGVEELEAVVANHAQQVASLTGVVDQFRTAVNAREQEAAYARQVIADQAAALRELQTTVDAREQEAVRASQVIAHQESMLLQAKTLLDLREREANDRKYVIAEQARVLDETRAALAALEASRSWRLTAPLRRLGDWLRLGR